jgi:hypothetical protein
MPASKVRKKAKTKIAADRKRLREQESNCADTCCSSSRSAPVITVGPRPAKSGVPDSPERQ